MENFNFKPNKKVEDKPKIEMVKWWQIKAKDLFKKILNNPFLKMAFLSTLISSGVFDTKAGDASLQDNNNDKHQNKTEENNVDNTIREYKEYIKNHKYFSQYPHSFMSWTASSEKPTDFQAERIINLHDSISKETKLKKFSTLSETIIFINQRLDSNFSNKKAFTNLKDVFPEQEGENTRALFDCDSRIVMIASVLQNIGFTPEDFVIYGMEGHMIIYSKKEQKYIEATTNKIVDLGQDEKVQFNEISSFNQYIAYVLSNRITEEALKFENNIFSKTKIPDFEKQLGECIKELKEVSALDNDNITIKLNLIHLLTLDQNNTNNLKEAVVLYKEFLLNLISKYFEAKEDNLSFQNDFLQNEGKFGEALKGLIKEALKESDYIRKKFADYASFVRQEINDYEEQRVVNELLLESLPETEKNSMQASFYRLDIINSIFKQKKFSSYLSRVEKCIEEITKTKDLSNEPREISYFEGQISLLEQQKLVAEIITGKLVISEDNIAEIITKYKDSPILGPLINKKEHWEFFYSNSVESLREWSGYDNLKNLFFKYEN
ncbi:MAG: hypothetical protein K9L98_00180 [Candidatus Pacebacteria bacterium]|nr:hypothetical protein [Candidatus Paceibacterota bacterium]MCF7862421.1 hypothetical protein [Candidatus Paceibacterota bacterium]